MGREYGWHVGACLTVVMLLLSLGTSALGKPSDCQISQKNCENERPCRRSVQRQDCPERSAESASHLLGNLPAGIGTKLDSKGLSFRDEGSLTTDGNPKLVGPCVAVPRVRRPHVDKLSAPPGPQFIIKALKPIMIKPKGPKLRRHIERRLRQHRDSFVDCYQQSLTVSSKLEGQFMLVVRIGAQGTVKFIEVKDRSPKFDMLTTCIRDVVASLRFPSPKSLALSFEVPFIFRTHPKPQ